MGHVVNTGLLHDEHAACAQTASSRIDGTFTLVGRTLYTSYGASDVGLALASDAKAVLIQNEGTTNNLERKVSNCGSVSEAIGRLADADTVTPGIQFKGRVVAVLNSAGVAQWVVIISDTPLIIGGGNVPSGGSYSDTVNGTNVNIALVDTPASYNVIATRAAMAVTNAGYKNATPAFLSSTPAPSNDDYGLMSGYLMAYDQNNNPVYFTVTYNNYWTIKVDGVTMETVLHGKDSTVYTGSKALSGKGSGYMLNSTYTAYNSPDLNTITTAQVIETGYAKVTNNNFTGATLTSAGATVTAGSTAFKVANGLTVTATITPDTTNAKNHTLGLGATTGATITSTNPQSVAAAASGTVTLTWNINTSNLSGDIADITDTVSNVPQSRTITYTTPTATETGVTATMDQTVTSAMDNTTVTVTLRLSGAASADTIFTIGGASVSWSGLDGGLMTLDSGKLKILNGANVDGKTVTFSFPVNGSSISLSIS